VAGLRLRSATPLRSAPLPPIAVAIVFLLCGAKKRTEIKDCPILIHITENFLNTHAYVSLHISGGGRTMIINKTFGGKASGNILRIAIGTTMLAILLGTSIAAAIPIDKTKTLGPYDSNHRYYIHIYNVDDIAKASVNGNIIVQTNYYQDSGWVDVTGYIVNGVNTIKLTNENTVGGWTYGFEIRQDNSNIIWQEFCGAVGSTGCMNNDGTQGIVYQNIITLTISTGIPSLQWPLVGTPKISGFVFGGDWKIAGSKCGLLWKTHVGVDLSAKAGDDVKASYAGTVKSVYNAGAGWANGIVIEHVAPDNSLFTTTYMHVNPLVKVNDHVTKDMRIATIANIVGPHLHFGVRNSKYSGMAVRGALPKDNKNSGPGTYCKTDYITPEYFIDPMKLNYEYGSTPPPTPTRSYTFQTTGNAMQITIDGTSYPSPKTVIWTDGTTHPVSVSLNQAIVSGQSQYAFTLWGGKSTSTSASISITAGATTYGTYTANYNTQYYLTVNTEPSGLTSILGSGWYNSGTIKSLTAPSSVGSYTFSTWKIDSSPASGNPISVAMNGKHTATAVYTNVVTPNPTLSISQASGVQGTTFYYTGNYFTPNTVTEWHVRKPDGNEYIPYDTSVSANSLGVFNRNWVSSCTSMLGTYTIWAVDKTNGKSSNVVSETVTASASCTNVQYTAQFAYTGWMSNWVQNAQTAGTPGGNQMEAIKITTTNYGITYRAHVAFDGWQSWVSNGAIAGTVGQAKSLQAIEIKLLNAPSNLHVYYRAYVHNQGWQGWVSDGTTAGTTGLGLAVDAIEIKIQN
jgi:murein DD-endopeptidase MepM/ murein hydrolase activator NlpD